MKILFAVSNENIAEAIKREYQSNYKAQLLTKNVYYFNAIIKELQNNKTYDVVIVSEDLEPFANNNYDTIDKFLSDKLVTIREEAVNSTGKNVPIIFITTDRHMLGDFLTSKLFEIGIYNALVGADRSIENVCTLMFHPRNKQEAKAYYRVNAEIDKGPREDDVKEEEIKNIIAHYKKLGKEEERYVESFDNIASQYNDAQLKVIIRFLPLNVKAVLEAQSPKYQKLTTFAGNFNTGSKGSVSTTESQNGIKEKNVSVDNTNNRVLEQISSVQNSSDVIIPNAMNVNRVRKIETGDENIDKVDTTIMARRKEDVKPVVESVVNRESNEEIEDVKVEEQDVPAVKRGRGRPKKAVDINAEEVAQAPKRGRGRPKKNALPEEPSSTIESFEEENMLPGFETETTNEPQENVLPGFDNLFDTEQKVESVSEPEVEDAVLPGFSSEPSNSVFDSLVEEKAEMQNSEPVMEPIMEPKRITENFTDTVQDFQATNSLLDKKSVRYENIEYLIPSDKRIATFVGTSKSGVSFIVNNLAQMISSFNINVAVLDLTKNKNSFYIYTNNDENLRNKASNSIYNLLEGRADGLKVNKNLTIYTALPTDTEEFYEADKVLKTLLDNHSVILIDADYDTPVGYFDNSTDVFMVQNMDILTMQPLTTFLKELKSKNILKDEKLRLIVNMEARVRGVNSQVLLNALAVYKDPGMAYTIELYTRESVKVFTIPFDMEAYNKYLTTLVECNLSLTGYPKSIISSLKEIATFLSPVMGLGNAKKNSTYTPPSLNSYSTSPFNGDMNSTLSHMKNKY